MKKLKKILKYIFLSLGGILGLFFVLTFLLWAFKSPSNDRDWELGQEKMPQIIFSNDQESVTIKNLRDTQWPAHSGKSQYKDLLFEMSDLKNLEVAVSHFSKQEGIGHVFLIFNLDDGRSFGLSVESRREKGEAFGMLLGLMFDYELLYVLASKDDLFGLREARDERVYLFPVKITAEKMQELFLLLSDRINSLYVNPEFYHLIFKNCTNLIADAVEKISDENFPLWEKTFMPGHAGRALFEMELIDSELESFEKVRERYLFRF